MRRLRIALGIAVAFFLTCGCQKQVGDNEAVRAGIMQHLAGVGTLNMSAMDMEIRNVSIDRNQAHAEVEFRLKSGGAPGTGMQVAYNLVKRDGAWVVVKSLPMGGMIQHPDPNQNPHQNANVHSSGMPNFNDVLNPGGASAPTSLPPGHPAVNSQVTDPLPDGQDQPSTKKPR
jgi:hypothetical protein